MLMFSILLVATLLMLFVSYLSFRKRKLDAAKYCALFMLSASFYSLGYAFEIISANPENARFWLHVQYIGIPFISTCWLILVIIFTGHQAVLKPWVMLLLFSVPVLTFVFQQTNDLHHFYYTNVQFNPDGSNLSPIVLSKGPWYWVHITYNYLGAAVGMGLFARKYVGAGPLVRRQVAVMMLGAAAPWLSNMIYLSEYRNMDLTPFGFALSGLVYIWGIYRFNLYRLVPIAQQTVFETMQDGVIILDDENQITHFNQAARHMVKEWKLTAKSINEVFASNSELLSKLMAPENGEIRVSIPIAEETRYYHVKISIMYGKSRIAMGKLIIFYDITQVTLYQEKLLANAKQLEELHAFKDKLFAVVTHDIRDPLALLVNLTEIIEEDFIDAGSEESRVFQELSSQVKDTYLLVENLLDWFRSRKGKIDFSPLVWELEPIVRQSVDAMKPRCEMKGIRVTAAVQEDIMVYADKEMLQLVLRNLLFNAVKFTETGGHIHVEANKIGQRVTVFVRDTGVGVPEEIGKSLFHEVQQGSRPGTVGERGTGLGLYLCGKFVRLHGGDIGYEDNRGPGSTFFFTLPANEASSARQKTWRELEAI